MLRHEGTAGRVLVTGAGGFIGRRLCQVLAGRGVAVRAVVRSEPVPVELRGCELAVAGNLGDDTDWESLLNGCGRVVHLAARIPFKSERPGEIASYIRDNVEVTTGLTDAALKTGVRRLVFVSTIKVKEAEADLLKGWEKAGVIEPDSRSAPVSPDNCYALTKAIAEEKIRAACSGSDLEYVIVRPPLVYGPGVAGNFDLLIRLLKSGVPLPLGAIRNERSFLYIDNLVDFVLLTLAHPAAADEIFQVADSRPLSTPELSRMIAGALGVVPRIFPMPVLLLNLLGRLTGKSEMFERLCGSCQVDLDKTREKLDWQAKISPEQGVGETIAWHREHRFENV